MAPVNTPVPQGIPSPPPVRIAVDTNNSLWDRLSNWASENKGVVYTIAGITLVVGAGGAVYYFSNDSRDSAADTAATKRKRQRERKRAKERAEKDSAPEKSAESGRSMQTSDKDVH